MISLLSEVTRETVRGSVWYNLALLTTIYLTWLAVKHRRKG